MQNEEKENEEQEDEKSGYYDVLHVPYVAGFSEKSVKDLKHVNVGETFQKGKTIFNSVCKLKPPKHLDERKNVIYCLGCNSCNQRYLGETQQFFPSRRYQHKYAIRCKQKTNGIAQHILNNKNTQLIGRTEFSWILSRIGEKGRLKKRFLLTALSLELL